ncbi:hypothetical protein HPB52_018755 [Rhipicephalus sanguineus]|uniref:Uncharacterized protein n=1 Tax=Rhipicephalus sanguineus TaxID=34632 RepID=A0A9D4PX18_RHISA|nr:hypothetical protein HPB52_018755 [Rhipicephalus sanguineus]
MSVGRAFVIVGKCSGRVRPEGVSFYYHTFTSTAGAIIGFLWIYNFRIPIRGGDGPGGTFKGLPRLTLAAAFATRPDVVAVRINHRRDIVTADASKQPCLSELLTIKELNGVPVTARVPADRRTSVGFVHGA